jgi:hypothetical protein
MRVLLTLLDGTRNRTDLASTINEHNPGQGDRIEVMLNEIAAAGLLVGAAAQAG